LDWGQDAYEAPKGARKRESRPQNNQIRPEIGLQNHAMGRLWVPKLRSDDVSSQLWVPELRLKNIWFPCSSENPARLFTASLRPLLI